jgi:hypothetical protein
VAKKESQTTGKGLPGVTKWIVLGVVALVFMVLFREPLTQLLHRATDIEITKEGVKIKTMQTPIGEVAVSVSNVSKQQNSSLSEGIHENSYIDKRDKFRISWPDNINWNASESLGQILHAQLNLPSTVRVPIVITKNEAADNFKPNINVVVELVGGGMTIDRYLELNIQQMEQFGWTILSSDSDEATQAGALVFLNNSFQNQIHQFQRLVIASGKAYIVTASQLPPDNLLSQQLRSDLKNILNSFQLIQ